MVSFTDPFCSAAARPSQTFRMARVLLTTDSSFVKFLDGKQCDGRNLYDYGNKATKVGTFVNEKRIIISFSRQCRTAHDIKTGVDNEKTRQLQFVHYVYMKI